jgi:two-component system, response regulator PdtaR
VLGAGSIGGISEKTCDGPRGTLATAGRSLMMSITRILLVEDDLLTGLDVASRLEASGFDVSGPAHDLTEGFALLQLRSPHAAVLDINLGKELVYPLARACLDRGIPVLFITGIDAAEIPQEMRSLPRLSRPFSGAQLENSIATAFGPATSS